MRKLATLLMAALVMTMAVPAFAQQQETGKDECLLASKNCLNEVDSIQKKVRKLNKEIKKGNKVYSPEELKKLQQKLQEANDILDVLESKKGE